MTLPFDNYTARTDVAATQAEEFIANAIQEDLPTRSLVLGAGVRRIPLSKSQARFPVLSLLPEAYFVNAAPPTGGTDKDVGLKATTRAAWANKFINVEELAVIVPIPENVIDDTDFDIFGQMRPMITEAIGQKIDEAVLFGVEKPTTWDLGDGATANGIAQIADARGISVTSPSNPGTAQYWHDLVALARAVADTGNPVTGFIGDSLFEYDLLDQTDGQGRVLFIPAPTSGGVATLLGRPFTYLNGGNWDDTYRLIAGDMRMLIVGMRKDFTFEVFREGVITDASGAVVMNLMQQDARALRVTMRLGVTVGNPLRRRAVRKGTTATAYPFGVLKP